MHWHRSNIKYCRHPYSENELFSTFKVDKQHNEASRTAVKHISCFSLSPDSGLQLSVLLTASTAVVPWDCSELYVQAGAQLLAAGSKWHCNIAAQRAKDWPREVSGDLRCCQLPPQVSQSPGAGRKRARRPGLQQVHAALSCHEPCSSAHGCVIRERWILQGNCSLSSFAALLRGMRSLADRGLYHQGRF